MANLNGEDLREEREWFEANRERLFQSYPRQIAVVLGHQLVGVYSTPEEAYNEGYRLCKGQLFLAKHILPSELPRWAADQSAAESLPRI